MTGGVKHCLDVARFCLSASGATSLRGTEAPQLDSRLREFSLKSPPLFLLVSCPSTWTACLDYLRSQGNTCSVALRLRGLAWKRPGYIFVNWWCWEP